MNPQVLTSQYSQEGCCESPGAEQLPLTALDPPEL